jgi:hypothetical protein
MNDDQLAASVEKIGERFLALRSVEDIPLLHSDPRQRAALPAQFIPGPVNFLFLHQMRLAGDEPFFPRDNLARFHVQLPCLWLHACCAPIAARQALYRMRSRIPSADHDMLVKLATIDLDQCSRLGIDQMII